MVLSDWIQKYNITPTSNLVEKFSNVKVIQEVNSELLSHDEVKKIIFDGCPTFKTGVTKFVVLDNGYCVGYQEHIIYGNKTIVKRYKPGENKYDI